MTTSLYKVVQLGAFFFAKTSYFSVLLNHHLRENDVNRQKQCQGSICKWFDIVRPQSRRTIGGVSHAILLDKVCYLITTANCNHHSVIPHVVFIFLFSVFSYKGILLFYGLELKNLSIESDWVKLSVMDRYRRNTHLIV